MALLTKASLVTVAAFALTLSFARAARAEHEETGLIAVALTPFGHMTQTPGYASIIYYGARPEKPMPAAWVAMNITTSVLFGGTSGVVAMYLALLDHVPPRAAAIGGVGGASVFAGSLIVITASIVQASRPSEAEPRRRDSALRSLVVLPTGGIAKGGGGAAGLTIAGRF